MKKELSLKRQKILAECETDIQRSHTAFCKMVMALRKIRRMNLFKPKYKTFEEYCEKRWRFSSSRARQLIASAEVMQNLKSVTSGSTSGDGESIKLPETERQIRPLIGLKAARQVEVWKKAVETTNNGIPTAKHVKDTRDETTPMLAPGRHLILKKGEPDEIAYNKDVVKAFKQFITDLASKYKDIVSIQLVPMIRSGEKTKELRRVSS